MSLLLKFGVLSLMLVATLFVSIGIPTWVASAADREVQAAQTNLMSFVEALNQIKHDLDSEAEELSGGSLSQKDRDRIATQSERINETLQKIESSARFRRYAGAGVAPAFAQRVQQTRSQLNEALLVDSSDARFGPGLAQAVGQLAQLQGVFDLVEDRLLGELQLTIAHSHEVRSLIQRVFIISLIFSLLVGTLAMLLLRRWVILPVLELRIAAGQIASGNFDYRISTYGHDELGVLSREINQMAATIADMQHQAVAQERFATMEEVTRRLAHNLRNPLAGIRSLAESARLELPTRGQLAEDLDLIISTVDRFEEWLAKLLHSATTLEIHASEDSPRAMLRAVYEAHLLMARAKSIDLILDVDHVPEHAVFDRMHLEQALVALTTNALEATPEGGSVRIVGAGSDRSPQWSIQVEDSGPGILGEDRDEVFRPYFTTKRGGTGLGLALVANVAQAHEGQVKIGDSALGGAALSIHLGRNGATNQSGEDHGQRRAC